ncbi:MAG: hypothetical protein CME70_03145 [Halobacteriovorax sp.]|nr:hypothetical protein [Halobacteriovorax sp.]MBK22979.1 hypothetical protein [Halobacteriovorax sp.]
MKIFLFFFLLFSAEVFSYEWVEPSYVKLIEQKNCSLCVGRMWTSETTDDLIVCSSFGTKKCKDAEKCFKNKVSEKKPSENDEVVKNGYSFKKEFVEFTKSKKHKLKWYCRVGVYKVDDNEKKKIPFEKWGSENISINWTTVDGGSPEDNKCIPDKDSSSLKCVFKISLPGRGESTSTCKTDVDDERSDNLSFKLESKGHKKGSDTVFIKAILPEGFKGKVDWFFKHVMWAKTCEISGKKNQFVTCPNHSLYARSAKATITHEGETIEEIEVFPRLGIPPNFNSLIGGKKEPLKPFTPIIVPPANPAYWTQGYY